MKEQDVQRRGGIEERQNDKKFWELWEGLEAENRSRWTNPEPLKQVLWQSSIQELKGWYFRPSSSDQIDLLGRSRKQLVRSIKIVCITLLLAYWTCLLLLAGCFFRAMRKYRIKTIQSLPQAMTTLLQLENHLAVAIHCPVPQLSEESTIIWLGSKVCFVGQLSASGIVTTYGAHWRPGSMSPHSSGFSMCTPLQVCRLNGGNPLWLITITWIGVTKPRKERSVSPTWPIPFNKCLLSAPTQITLTG